MLTYSEIRVCGCVANAGSPQLKARRLGSRLEDVELANAFVDRCPSPVCRFCGLHGRRHRFLSGVVGLPQRVQGQLLELVKLALQLLLLLLLLLCRLRLRSNRLLLRCSLQRPSQMRRRSFDRPRR